MSSGRGHIKYINRAICSIRKCPFNVSCCIQTCFPGSTCLSHYNIATGQWIAAQTAPLSLTKLSNSITFSKCTIMSFCKLGHK